MFKIIKVGGVELEVHDDGKIYSVPRISANGNRLKRRLRKQSNSCGYLQVGIFGEDGVSMPVRVHRLVAQAFLDDWDQSMCVDHIDTNRRNNHVSNLRMVTRAENARLYREEQSPKYGLNERFHGKNGYKNVSKAKGGKFMAQMRVNGKRLSNGTKFRSALDAACAVNEMCVKHGMPMCKFNVPLEAKRVLNILPLRWHAGWYAKW